MVSITDIAIYYLPIVADRTLSFGAKDVDHITVVRVALHGRRQTDGVVVTGWADVPLNIGWAWPQVSFRKGEKNARTIIETLRRYLIGTTSVVDPFFWYRNVLQPAFHDVLRETKLDVPDLLKTMCIAPFDIAFHDLFGCFYGAKTYDLYNTAVFTDDLGAVCSSPSEATPSEAARLLSGVFPKDIFVSPPPLRVTAWHLVGLSDTVGHQSDGTGLMEWVRDDGLTAVKVKLNGGNLDEAIRRLADIRSVLVDSTVTRLSIDFNGTVLSQHQLLGFIKKIEQDAGPRIAMIEQPFPAPGIEKLSDEVVEICRDQGIVLSLDESVLNLEDVIAARENGWTGVVVKTCKTQTRSLLIAALARRLSLKVVVQDLTNPMLALIAHLQLAAHLDDGWGAEVNAVQFYPQASLPESQVHPEAFRRRGGTVSIESFSGCGLGYRLSEIARTLPRRAA